MEQLLLQQQQLMLLMRRQPQGEQGLMVLRVVLLLVNQSKVAARVRFGCGRCCESVMVQRGRRLWVLLIELYRPLLPVMLMLLLMLLMLLLLPFVCRPLNRRVRRIINTRREQVDLRCTELKM